MSNVRRMQGIEERWDCSAGACEDRDSAQFFFFFFGFFLFFFSIRRRARSRGTA